MELWGRLQHNTVRDSRYGPLGTEKTSFGELSGRSEKKIVFFSSYKNGSTNLMPQLEKSADLFFDKLTEKRWVCALCLLFLELSA